MASLNKVLIAGNLGKDPEINQTHSGLAVVNMSVATTSKKPKADGNSFDTLTEWHNIVVWGKKAEACAQYLKKGSGCFIEGHLQTRKYEKDGVNHYNTAIVAENVQFLDSKNQSPPPNGGAARPTLSPSEENMEAILDDLKNIPF